MSSILDVLEINITGATATVTNAAQIFEAHLPEGLTMEHVEKSNEYQREFQAAVTEKALPAMVEAMKSYTKLGLLSLETSLAGRSLGVVLTRPDVEKPTELQYQDGIAVYVKDTLHDNITASVERASKLWAN
jgi:hypothetical protein